MIENPLFSILIAQYNNGRYFEDCYNSIIAQTYDNWEVIIVDDGSTDDSIAVMKKFIGDDIRFKLYQNEKNEGCGYTKRRLAELALGEICGFLDPDDAITPEALQLMIEEHQKHPEASMIYSKPFICDVSLDIISERLSKQIEQGDPYFFNFDGSVFHFISFKSRSYRMTGGIDQYLQRAVDQDLVFLLYEKGSIIFLDKALYYYRIHDSGISTNHNRDKAYFWHWVSIISAAKRRKINVEDLFLKNALNSRREAMLEAEITGYNKSIIFKILRKLGLFRI